MPTEKVCNKQKEAVCLSVFIIIYILVGFAEKLWIWTVG